MPYHTDGSEKELHCSKLWAFHPNFPPSQLSVFQKQRRLRSKWWYVLSLCMSDSMRVIDLEGVLKYSLHLLTISLSLQNKTSVCSFRLRECQYKTLYHSKCDGVFLLEHLVCYPYFRSFLSENYSKMAFWIYLPQKLQIFAPQPTANGRDVRIVLKPGLAGHVICSKRIFHPLVPPSGHAFAIIFHSELFASTYLNSWNSY